MKPLSELTIRSAASPDTHRIRELHTAAVRHSARGLLRAGNRRQMAD
jgi:hypothetical protein